MQAGKWGAEVKVFYLKSVRRVLQVTPPFLTKGKPSPVCVPQGWEVTWKGPRGKQPCSH